MHAAARPAQARHAARPRGRAGPVQTRPEDEGLSDAGGLPFSDCLACHRRVLAVHADAGPEWNCCLCGAVLPELFWLDEDELEMLGWAVVDPTVEVKRGCSTGGCGTGACGRREDAADDHDHDHG